MKESSTLTKGFSFVMEVKDPEKKEEETMDGNQKKEPEKKDEGESKDSPGSVEWDVR